MREKSHFQQLQIVMKCIYICSISTFFSFFAYCKEKISIGLRFEVNQKQLEIKGREILSFENENICSFIISEFEKDKKVSFKDFKFVSMDAVDESLKIKLVVPDKQPVYFRLFWADGAYYMEMIDIDQFLNSLNNVDPKKYQDFMERNPTDCKKANIKLVKMVEAFRFGRCKFKK